MLRLRQLRGEQMKELKINNQFTLYYKNLHNGGTLEPEYLIELHDFNNLCFYREVVDESEVKKIKANPSSVFNYYELT